MDKESQKSFIASLNGTYRTVAAMLISDGRLPEAQQVLGLLKDEEYFEFIRRDGKQAASLTSAVALTTPEDNANRQYEDIANRVTAIGNEWASLRAKPSRTADEDKHLAELSARLKQANQEWNQFLNGLYADLGKTKQAQQDVASLQENASGMQSVLRQLGTGRGGALHFGRRRQVSRHSGHFVGDASARISHSSRRSAQEGARFPPGSR